MIVAGVDVGNATTEVVLVDRQGTAVRIVGADRVPTRGQKGSPESLRTAATLVRRVERATGARVGEAAVAPLRAVDTDTASVPEATVPTGRLRVVAAGVRTPGGRGACVGRPMLLGEPEPHAGRGHAPEPVVALVPAAMGYAEAAGRLRSLVADGVDVGAVLVSTDEGVLVANRTGGDLPVVDQVDTGDLVGAVLVAVEVRDAGQPLRLLTDPVALAAALALGAHEAADATAVTRLLVDRSNAVVALDPDRRQVVQVLSDAWIEVDGDRQEFGAASRTLAARPVGTARSFRLPGAPVVHVDDLYTVDLGEAADRAGSRRGTLGSRSFLLAALRRRAAADHAGLLADALGVDVRTVASEPAAARTGALTTPGGRPDALVVDLGAGTIDAIAPGGEVVAAGAGALLTHAVATTLGVPRAAADWIKRGPCLRVEGGQRFEAEDGSRGFLERPAPAAATGMLVATGPAGLLPFDRDHSPAEWRALRLRLKEAIFGANLGRVLGSGAVAAPQVLVVGGPAGDDELLGVLARSLPEGVAVGRAAVGGTLGGAATLGHRYAAALGLALHLVAAE